MSKCACCSGCGEPIQEPHNNDGLCNECSPYIETCYCGEVICSLAEYNYHRAGEWPCAPRPLNDDSFGLTPEEPTTEKIWQDGECPF